MDLSRPRFPVRTIASTVVLASLLGLGFVATSAGAQPANSRTEASVEPGERLPATVRAALARVGLPLADVALVVQAMDAPQSSVLAWNASQPMNPASVMKLLTSLVALETLGPQFQWLTPVWLDGPVRDGVLEGNLVIKGSGDPQLVQERLWLMFKRVQQLGVREIRGDIVMDRSAFAADDGTPAEFDGEAHRSYNVRAEALLLNFRSSIYSFVPDASRGTVLVAAEPPLTGRSPHAPLQGTSGPCGDWRTGLRLRVGDASAPASFSGSFPLACGEQSWALADPDPGSFNARLLAGLWRDMGGELKGRVREGTAPAGRPSFEMRSKPLGEVLRDVNKFSNNVMSQQVFLTLALQAPAVPATAAAGREVLRQWLATRVGSLADNATVDNGSGLSRDNRLSAAALARLLLLAHGGPYQADFFATLPIWGVDGTLRRWPGTGVTARLKTGSLRDVSAIAGEVLAGNGRRYAVVAMVNHPQAIQARPAFEALVQWVLRLPASAPR